MSTPRRLRSPTRRAVLRGALAAVGALAASPFVAGCGGGGAGPGATVVLPGLGALDPPDANGLRLPAGFTSRVVAVAGLPPVAGGAYAWHRNPDGGAVFPGAGGGWVYVSNSERTGGAGGAGALAFDAQGAVIDAYPVLQGTSGNCAGGATPWGTWLSCEERAFGRVVECDPSGATPGVERPALGSLAHEAAAVDPVTLQVYMTEDEPDGRLYRFTPAGTVAPGMADLGAGLLEVAHVEGTDAFAARAVTWLAVPQPNPETGPDPVPTRYQVPASTAFDGGEGLVHHGGAIHFSTKGDNRVWSLDLATSTLALLYDGAVPQPVIWQVDNLAASAGGTVFVAEDGPLQRIAAFTPDGRAGVVLQLEGHAGSELTGPALDPSESRLYFSSQRGPAPGGAWGVTFEVRGPFASI